MDDDKSSPDALGTVKVSSYYKICHTSTEKFEKKHEISNIQLTRFSAADLAL